MDATLCDGKPFEKLEKDYLDNTNWSVPKTSNGNVNFSPYSVKSLFQEESLKLTLQRP
jgi:hypothetical protein